MQNLAFTHLGLFNGKLDGDLQEDVTRLVALEKRGKTTGGVMGAKRFGAQALRDS